MPKRVFVDLYDSAKNLLQSNVEIPHLAGGLFIDNVIAMPNVDTVIARYRVTDSDGTTPSVDHGVATDRYQNFRTLFSGIELGSSNNGQDMLIGVLEDFSLSGSIEPIDSIIGIIQEE